MKSRTQQIAVFCSAFTSCQLDAHMKRKLAFEDLVARHGCTWRGPESALSIEPVGQIDVGRCPECGGYVMNVARTLKSRNGPVTSYTDPNYAPPIYASNVTRWPGRTA